MPKAPAPKHLTITIDFDLQTEGSTVHYQRARAAYEAAVEAAIREAKKVLPPDSIRGITSEIDWSYRWTRDSDVQFRRPDLIDEIEETSGQFHPCSLAADQKNGFQRVEDDESEAAPMKTRTTTYTTISATAESDGTESDRPPSASDRRRMHLRSGLRSDSAAREVYRDGRDR
jgi:hypothetical protein